MTIEVPNNSVWYEPPGANPFDPNAHHHPLRYRVLNDIGFMMTPKCGSTSLCRGHMIGVCRGYPEDNARVAFVRDPMERLQSAFSTMHSENYFNGSYSEFIDLVLEGERNPHWEPQVNFFNQVPVLWLFPFQDFVKVLWEQFGVQVPHLRRRREDTPEVDPQYRVHELLDLYEDDVALWTEVTEKGTMLHKGSQSNDEPRILTGV